VTTAGLLQGAFFVWQNGRASLVALTFVLGGDSTVKLKGKGKGECGCTDWLAPVLDKIKSGERHKHGVIKLRAHVHPYSG
jgi:hypothetical protein